MVDSAGSGSLSRTMDDVPEDDAMTRDQVMKARGYSTNGNGNGVTVHPPLEQPEPTVVEVRTCDECGGTVEGRRDDARYCSTPCRRRAAERRRSRSKARNVNVPASQRAAQPALSASGDVLDLAERLLASVPGAQLELRTQTLCITIAGSSR